MSIYGVVSNVAGGHVATTILIALIAMLFTAISYGRMARVYPSAGSAYTYVGKEIHPLAGYVVGWAMLMDYVLNPIICAVWCSAASQDLLPNSLRRVGCGLCRSIYRAESARSTVLRAG